MRVIRSAAAIAVSFAVPAQELPRGALEVGAAAVAKITASAVFVSGRTLESVRRAELAPEDRLREMLQPLVEIDVDRDAGRVTARLLGVERIAVHRPGVGCALVLDGVLPAGADYAGDAVAWEPDVAWPTGDAGAAEPVPDGVDRDALARAVDGAFAGHAPPLDPRTRAVVVVHAGRIVAERYADGFTVTTPLAGWSMTKSLVDALVGLRVAEGGLRTDAPAEVPAWIDDGDQRAFLTPEHLLRMTTGLAWNERYDDMQGDVARMLFAETDAAAFAAARALEDEPGKTWKYSSGNTNVLCAVLRATFDDLAEYHAFARRALFARIGMRSALIETDPSGTLVGSSFGWATARDWARFGMLYLHGGRWAGEPVLPDGWVAASTEPTPGSGGRYGRHWWLNRDPRLPPDLFSAEGYEGQTLAVVPSRDAVVVRLGCTRDGRAFDRERFLAAVLAALPARSGPQTSGGGLKNKTPASVRR